MKKITLLCLLVALATACNAHKEETHKKIEESNEQSKEIVKTQEIPQENKFDIENITTTNGNNPTISITMSENLESQDIEGYVKVTPKVDGKIIKMKNHIILTGNFDVNKKYSVTILKGLKGEKSTLEKDISENLTFKEIEPKLVFSNEGIILPKVSKNKIAFRGVNVKKINVKVAQIFPNNITQFLQDFSFKGNGNVLDYSMQSNMYKLGDTILNKEYDLKCEKNIWTQNEIDLSNLVKEKGIYVVELSFNKDGVEYTFPENTPDWQKNYLFENNGKIGKAILITDMAMVAQKEKSGKLIANVIDVVTNKPLENVEVQGISVNNQLIGKQKTNKNGEVIFDKADKIFYLIAEKGNDFSLLKMSDSKLSYDGFLVDGDFNEDKTRAFIYSSRGIYRPGDEINIGIIARDENQNFPKNQPIKIDVFTPRGDKYIDGKILKDGKDGFFTFTFNTEKSDETGLWTVVAYIDGQNSKRFSLKIPVEAIVPYKIEIKTEFPKDVDLKTTKEIIGELKSKYLFGNPAKDLSFTSQINIQEENISFPQYKNFTFSNPTTYVPNFTVDTKGVLNENGEAKVVFSNLPNNIPQNMTLKGEIVTKVIEPSGRPVININNIIIDKLDSYVGIQNLENNFVKSGNSLNLQVIAVDKDGKMVPGRKIKYRVYKNEYSWWWDYYDYNNFIKSIKNDKNTVLLYEQEFETTDNPYTINYEVEGMGEIFVEVEDMQTKQTAGTNLYVSSWQDANTSKIIDRLKIQSDKKSYKVGEKAKITFEGAKGNRALVTLTKSGKIINRYWKEVEGLNNEIEIDVNQDMFPNGYVTVALFQNYGESSNDRPLRLYGAVPIIVEDNSKKLDLSIETPDVLKPFEKFKVKVISAQKGKVDYTLSVVDEGLLGITDFKTPNAYNYFYQKEGLQLGAYDNYSEIIGKTFGDVHQVLTPGGDHFVKSMNMAAKLNQFGFEKSERFKPLSIFKGVLTTSENGEGEVEIELPNYNGAVRVMVTGASQDKYGMAQKKVEVKSPIIADLSMPRVLKIGDKVEVPATIFALEKDLGEIEVTFNFEGKEQKQTLNLKSGESKKLTFDIEVGNNIGNQKAVLTVSSKTYTTKEEINIDVTSDNPYTYINKIVFLKSGELNLDIPQESVKNSVGGQVVISTKPLLSIENRIKELTRYPYGCLEQIVSMAIPQLYISQLTNSNKIDKQVVVKNINNTIKKLSDYQLPSGGFSYWPGNKEESLWATVYAGQFMLNAKEQGYYIPSQTYNLWVDFIKDMIRGNQASLELRAYALYVLSLSGETELGELNYIYDNDFTKLSQIGQWYVAGAYNNIGEQSLAKKIAKELETNIEESNDEVYSYNFGSKLRDEAVVLDIYYKIFNNVDEKLYSDIVKNLQSKEWLSTQTLGYAMLALGQMNPINENLPLKAAIIVDGKEQDILAKNGIYTLPLNSDINKVTVKGENLFVNEYWEGIPIKYERANESNNIIIERKFYAENGKEIDVKSLEAGTSFYMEFKLLPTSNEKYFNVDNVALSQILPSGWEIENLRGLNLKYPKWILDQTYDNGLEYEDIRDDRVNIFFDFNNYSSKNGQKFFVKVNAVTKGEYTLPGTVVEDMYNSAYNAYLQGFKVEVK